MTENIEQFSK